MKAVLISIKPKWCEKIASGEKTIEVRKTHPRMETPFKCYIYCTQPKYPHEDFLCVDAGTEKCKAFYGGGKVIGEFRCDEIETYDDDTIHAFTSEDYSRWNDFDLDRACIHPEDFEHYANDNWLYGWHVSDLVIYDEPKELSEFWAERICNRGNERDECAGCWDCEKRPPQSWCYVEELEK